MYILCPVIGVYNTYKSPEACEIVSICVTLSLGNLAFMHAEVLIIGAGISGLVSAYRQQQAFRSVLVLERSNRLGGSIDTHYADIPYEYGPNTFLSSHQHMMQLVSELGLEEALLRRDFSKTQRYLYTGRKLLKVSPVNFLRGEILSIGAIIRVLAEPWSRRGSEQEETVHEFMERKFGLELAELAASFLQGVWAADSRKLSAEAVLQELYNIDKQGSSILLSYLHKAFKPKSKSLSEKLPDARHASPIEVLSFREGMSSLVEALADKIGRKNIILGAEPSQAKGYNSIILATKAFQAAEILANYELGLDATWANELASLLAQIQYNPISLLTISFPRRLFKKEFQGFGFLSHVHSNLNTLGTIWSSELFRERRLADDYLFTIYARPSLETDFHEQLIAEQISVLRPYARSKLELGDFKIIDSKTIQAAIPQYDLGYPKLIREIQAKVAQQDKLSLVGNYLDGISLNSLVAKSSIA